MEFSKCDVHLYECQKEDPGNYRSVSLTSVLEKAMEQIILNATMWHTQDNQMIRSGQHERQVLLD